MKYVALLFSIYFTLLALIPCQDRYDISTGANIITIQQGHLTIDEPGHAICTPFCSCSCCSIARALTKHVVMNVFIFSISRKYPDYGIPAVKEQTINIWQPPQIS